MTRLICLANSMRDGGRCVAGIDRDTGRWIRPVPRKGGPIPAYRLFIGKHFLSPLDVVELNLADGPVATEFQRENRIIRGWDWLIVDRVESSALLRYPHASAPILHNNADRVSAEWLRRLPPLEWISLQLVRPRKTTFERGTDKLQRVRWRALFEDARGDAYRLRVTDPDVCDRLNQGDRVSRDCLLTVSLTEPWPMDQNCYKVVAAVIDL